MSISYFGIRCRPIPESSKFQTRNILGHQGHTQPWKQEGQLSLETSTFIWPSGCDDDARAVFGCKASQSHESEPETYKQMAAVALDHGRPTDDGQSISSFGQSDYHEGRKQLLYWMWIISNKLKGSRSTLHQGIHQLSQNRDRSVWQSNWSKEIGRKAIPRQLMGPIRSRVCFFIELVFHAVN